MIYIDISGYTFDFDGLIQRSPDGYGHSWVTLWSSDIVPEIMMELANEKGIIESGASAIVGGCLYRAIQSPVPIE